MRTQHAYGQLRLLYTFLPRYISQLPKYIYLASTLVDNILASRSPSLASLLTRWLVAQVAMRNVAECMHAYVLT